MIKLYSEFTKNFNNNGIGPLKDAYNTKVTEELNGELTLSLEYPIEGKYAKYITNRNIIKCDAGLEEEQLFRIKRVVPSLTTLKVVANHISYDLSNNLLEDCYPQNMNGQSFLNWILSKTQFEHDFYAYSNITNIATARYVRKNPIEAIIGDLDNSFVNLFGGELQRNNFKLSMLKQRGSDKGYRIKYRKNITGLEITEDDNELATRLMPLAHDGLLLPEKYVDSPLINNYSQPYIKILECNDIKVKENSDAEDGYETKEQAYEAMRKCCQNAFLIDNVDKTSINIKVDFVELQKTTYYKKYSHLQSLELGDIVTLIRNKNLSYKLRIIKTVYDVGLKRFTSLELGEFKSNFVVDTNSTLNTTMEAISKSAISVLEKAKNNATEQLTNAMGGYIYKTQNELFIMDTDNPNTCKKVWRWNLKGLGYSKSGINGPYELAMTQDGQFVADFITAGTLNAELIKVAWNGVTNYIQIESAGNLNIYDSDKRLLMKLNKDGLNFYKDQKFLGYIGTSRLVGTELRGLSFNLSNNATYMDWAFDENGDNEYTPVFRFDKRYGLLLKTDLSSEGNAIYIGSNKKIKIQNNNIVRADNSNVILGFTLDEVLNCYNDLDMNTWSITNCRNVVTTPKNIPTVKELAIAEKTDGSRYLQVASWGDYVGGIDFWASDARLKEDIKESNIDALEVINKIPHRSFKWLGKQEIQKIGYIAQELEEIEPNFVLKVENGEDYTYQIRESGIIPYISRAIQQLYKKIEKQDKFIDFILNKFKLTKEFRNIFEKEDIMKKTKDIDYKKYGEKIYKTLSRNFEKEEKISEEIEPKIEKYLRKED